MKVQTQTRSSSAVATQSGRQALVVPGLAAAVAAAVATSLVAVVGKAGGIDFEVPAGSGESIPVLAFANLAFVFSVIGLAIAAGIRRWNARPARTFLRVALALTAVSLVPPFLFGAGAATACASGGRAPRRRRDRHPRARLAPPRLNERPDATAAGLVQKVTVSASGVRCTRRSARTATTTIWIQTAVHAAASHATVQPSAPRLSAMVLMLVSTMRPPARTPRMRPGSRRTSQAAIGAATTPPTSNAAAYDHSIPWLPSADQEAQRPADRHDELGGVDRAHHLARLEPARRQQRGGADRAPATATDGVHEAADEAERHEEQRRVMSLELGPPTAEREEAEQHVATEERAADRPSRVRRCRRAGWTGTWRRVGAEPTGHGHDADGAPVDVAELPVRGAGDQRRADLGQVHSGGCGRGRDPGGQQQGRRRDAVGHAERAVDELREQTDDGQRDERTHGGSKGDKVRKFSRLKGIIGSVKPAPTPTAWRSGRRQRRTAPARHAPPRGAERTPPIRLRTGQSLRILKLLTGR